MQDNINSVPEDKVLVIKKENLNKIASDFLIKDKEDIYDIFVYPFEFYKSIFEYKMYEFLNKEEACNNDDYKQIISYTTIVNGYHSFNMEESYFRYRKTSNSQYSIGVPCKIYQRDLEHASYFIDKETTLLRKWNMLIYLLAKNSFFRCCESHVPNQVDDNPFQTYFNTFALINDEKYDFGKKYLCIYGFFYTNPYVEKKREFINIEELSQNIDQYEDFSKMIILWRKKMIKDIMHYTKNNLLTN